VLVAQLQVREVQDLDRAKVGRLVNGGLESPSLAKNFAFCASTARKSAAISGAVTAIVSSLQALLSVPVPGKSGGIVTKASAQAQDILEDVFLEMGIELRAQLKRSGGRGGERFLGDPLEVVLDDFVNLLSERCRIHCVVLGSERFRVSKGTQIKGLREVKRGEVIPAAGESTWPTIWRAEVHTRCPRNCRFLANAILRKPSIMR